MPKVAINTPAPDFILVNFQGERVQLSNFKGISNVLLVFNRGFT
jgi:peroxiredoxin